MPMQFDSPLTVGAKHTYRSKVVLTLNRRRTLGPIDTMHLFVNKPNELEPSMLIKF